MARSSKKEEKLQTTISDYMKSRYPHIDFFCDVAAGLKLPIWIASMVKRWRSRKGFPDMYIFVPRGNYAMLQLELKADGADLYKQDGELRKSQHLKEQNDVHLKMCLNGYCAMFTKGEDHTKAVIEWYISGAEGFAPEFTEIKKANIFS